MQAKAIAQDQHEFLSVADVCELTHESESIVIDGEIIDDMIAFYTFLGNAGDETVIECTFINQVLTIYGKQQVDAPIVPFEITTVTPTADGMCKFGLQAVGTLAHQQATNTLKYSNHGVVIFSILGTTARIQLCRYTGPTQNQPLVKQWITDWVYLAATEVIQDTCTSVVWTDLAKNTFFQPSTDTPADQPTAPDTDTPAKTIAEQLVAEFTGKTNQELATAIQERYEYTSNGESSPISPMILTFSDNSTLSIVDWDNDNEDNSDTPTLTAGMAPVEE